MNSRAHRHTRNDTLRDICCLIVPPFYSFLSQGCRNEEVRHALGFLCLEVISFTLDSLGGSQYNYLLASFLFSAIIIFPLTSYVYLIKRSRIRALNKPEAEQLLILEIVFVVIQLILSGVSYFKIRSVVNNPSLFPLAFTIIAVVCAFKNSKTVPHSSSHTSDTPPPQPPDQLEDTKLKDPLQLTHVQVDPSDTPSQVSKPEVVPSETRNQNFEPGSSNASEVQRTPSTGSLRKRKNATSKSDRGQKNEVANEIQPERSTSSKDQTTSEQSDDQVKSSSKFVTAMWPVKLVLLLVGILSSFILLRVAIIPYIFNLILPMFSRLPSFWIFIKILLSPPYIYILINFIIITIAASSFQIQHHQPTKTKKKLFGSRDESDSRDIPRNSPKNTLSSDIWAQMVDEDGVKEEKEEKPIFSNEAHL